MFSEIYKKYPEVDISLIKKPLDKLGIESHDFVIGKETIPFSEDIFNELVRICYDKNTTHYQWNDLAGEIECVYLVSQIPKTFSKAIEYAKPLIDNKYFNFVMNNSENLNNMIDRSRNKFNSFAIKTLKKTYLLRFNKDGNVRILEDPQYMWLRVASFIHFPNLEAIKTVYDDLSLGRYTHATPTLCNAGLRKPQLASCFLAQIPDNMEGIAKGWRDSAIISMNMGGIGKDYSALRHGVIGNNGESRGVPPWIRIESEIMKQVDQGGQKRKGSQTVYISDWHIDIFEIIDMKKETTPEDMRAQDMFYAIWVSDEFMRRVRDDEMWTLFCPNKTNKLYKKWGKEFERSYKTLEKEYNQPKHKNKVYVRQVRARELFEEIIRTQFETGMPFILYKDAVNRKCNQNHLGTIRCSNLCCEITEYVDEQNIASCNLASIALSKFVDTKTKTFNYSRLGEATRQLVRNLNNVIDKNFYPTVIPEIKATNMRNRPLGIGIQALADVFAMMDVSWLSEEAKKINRNIFEVMYYNAVLESSNIAKKLGSHETHTNSLLSKGFFQHDLWRMEELEKQGIFDQRFVSIEAEVFNVAPGEMYTVDEWNELRKHAKEFMYNSLLIALMPTASSAQILNNNEAFEPFTKNIYARSVLGGQFSLVNKHLVDDLNKRGLWNSEVSKQIIKDSGSVKNILTEYDDKKFLKHIKEKYKTVYEIPQKVLADMHLSRGRFVCQTQSMNCWLRRGDDEFNRLYNYLMYMWKHGAKTGMYYLRADFEARPMDVANEASQQTVGQINKKMVCTEDVCVMCSS